MSAIDKEMLQKYYKSPSLNFELFQKVASSPKKGGGGGSSNGPLSPGAAAGGIAASASNSSSVLGSPIGKATSNMALSPLAGPHGQSLLSQAVPSASKVQRPMAAASPLPPIAGGGGATNLRGSLDGHPLPAGATGSYIEFLRQLQQIQKLGGVQVATLGEITEQRRRLQTELLSQSAQGMHLVQDAEASGNWGLSSKYDCSQLVRDCMLDVDPSQLDAGAAPIVLAVDTIIRHLASLQTSSVLANRGKAGAPCPEDMKLFFEQSQRRLLVLKGACEASNSDYSKIGAILDTLLVSVEQCLDLGDVESLIKNFEDSIDHIAFEIERCNQKKQAAIEDGEVIVAEKCLYECIDRSEDLIKTVIEKTHAVEASTEVTQSLATLVEKHHEGTKPSFAALRNKYQSMKNRCQKDVAKVYALREKVEEVEAATAAKVRKDMATCDDTLRLNMEKIEATFAAIGGLEQTLAGLIRDRQREYVRRMTEKDKDEHRRTEYVQFCNVVAAHGSNIERTITNMDALIHACDMCESVGDTGFAALKTRNEKRLTLLSSLNSECCKQHADTVRSYFAYVGDIQYRKERMVQEIDHSVQQAFIQKELLAATFSPNAKKFGDIKKKLLQSRVELEEDLTDIVSRSATVMEAFKSSERYLVEHKIAFVHPSHAQLERSLRLRAKAIESRAAACGHNDGDPLLKELHEAQEEVAALGREAERINEATSNTLGRSMPMLRAATRSISTH